MNKLMIRTLYLRKKKSSKKFGWAYRLFIDILFFNIQRQWNLVGDSGVAGHLGKELSRYLCWIAWI